MKAVYHIDFQKLEARQMVVAPLGAAPGTPVVGQVYTDTTVNGGALRVWDGTAFTNRATDSVLHGGQTLAQVLARSAHTGTQTASTISDLATTVKAYRLDEFAVPTATISLNSQRISNLAEPTVDTDAATRGYVLAQVSSAAAGIDAKASVRIATTANDTLSGLAARDGVTPVAGDRILAKNQTTGSANGVYIAAAGAWARAADSDTGAEINPGAFWYVEEGTTNAGTQWRLATTGTIVLGTTSLTINQFGAGTVYTGSNGILLTGSNFTAVPKPSGGLSVDASGLFVDTAIVARKFSALITGSTIATVTHNLGTQDVIVSVRDAATNEIVIADVIANGVNTVTVQTASGGANAFRVTVLG